MKIIVSGRNIDLTEAIKDYVHEKIGRLDQHFDFVREVHVFLSVAKNPSIRHNQTAEATVQVNGAIIRVTVSTENLYGSIDELVRKVDRSMKKHKTKLMKRVKHDPNSPSIRRTSLEETASEEGPETGDEEDEIFFTFNESSEEALSGRPD